MMVSFVRLGTTKTAKWFKHNHIQYPIHASAGLTNIELDEVQNKIHLIEFHDDDDLFHKIPVLNILYRASGLSTNFKVSPTH